MRISQNQHFCSSHSPSRYVHLVLAVRKYRNQYHKIQKKNSKQENTHIYIILKKTRSLYTHKDPLKGSAGAEERRKSKACDHECLLAL